MSGGEAFTHDIKYAVEAIWKVLLWSVVLGAGLPMIFAFGVRSFAWGSADGSATGGKSGPGSPVGKVLAFVLFAIVLYILVLGIYYIIVTGHGKELKFDSVWPSQVEKK